MRLLCVLQALLVTSVASATGLDEFSSAQNKWRAVQATSYSFIFEWSGGVVIAPACADAKILVRVRHGVSSVPRVIRGSRRCPAGTSGERAIGFSVPSTIEAAFSEMSRYIETPPVRAKVTARYDEATGAPLEYYVEKLEIYDNDEGFRISGLRLQR